MNVSVGYYAVAFLDRTTVSSIPDINNCFVREKGVARLLSDMKVRVNYSSTSSVTALARIWIVRRKVFVVGQAGLVDFDVNVEQKRWKL